MFRRPVHGILLILRQDTFIIFHNDTIIINLFNMDQIIKRYGVYNTDNIVITVRSL